MSFSQCRCKVHIQTSKTADFNTSEVGRNLSKTTEGTFIHGLLQFVRTSGIVPHVTQAT